MGEKIDMHIPNGVAAATEQTKISNEELSRLQQTMHEHSEHEGKIVDLGTLSSDINDQLWNGRISLKSRLESRELTIDEVNMALARLGISYVPVTIGSSKRCIDGSSIVGYDDKNAEWYTRGLGPQIQGGSFGEAVSLRLWQGIRQEKGISFIGDMKALAKRPSRFKRGGHTDNEAGGIKTGCGQYDGQVRKLPRYGKNDSGLVIEQLAATILSIVDAKPNAGDFKRIARSSAALAKMPDYFADPTAALNSLAGINPTGVETLVRPHNEVALVLNFVSDTTFHRDHFNAQTSSKIQSFGLDAWNIFEEYPDEGYALVADAVATAMDLTDGSLRLFARLPR